MFGQATITTGSFQYNFTGTQACTAATAATPVTTNCLNGFVVGTISPTTGAFTALPGNAGQIPLPATLPAGSATITIPVPMTVAAFGATVKIAVVVSANDQSGGLLPSLPSNTVPVTNVLPSAPTLLTATVTP
jgi:hypothetical protein